MFLKYMALEYLTCHWDCYLGKGNKFYIYMEPNNEKYYFFSYDFDSTLVKENVQNLFNLQALEPRIDYLYEFLKDDMYWDIDSFAFKTFDTKYFAEGDFQYEPIKKTIYAQFSDLTNTDNLKAFIKHKLENLA
ncbi:hypothetical protein BCR32DRAFT_302126 [Anaeromyces robustus]|uniref:Uncharacterized protein n=1 Tax=Anaeromyces robustus TaxID=1754192 RepID=A0A1Y1WY53_9FUNG|nr:hypothetical protein BCR32DRAFT_302126 [Anaeromyces robustus]|eukprot:ORX78034.1 hypothetical protein BCR32DRAFT_302126 [Anaeromyces robustus]